MNNVIAKLRAKKDSKKGFTLMEMLIVVAIIAILVAVSIPVFTSQLEKAKQATDMANERAAKGMASTLYLLNQDPDTAAKAIEYTDHKATFNYDVIKGELTSDAVDGYGKCSEHSGQYIKATIQDNGTITIEWSTSKNLDSDEAIAPTTAKSGG